MAALVSVVPDATVGESNAPADLNLATVIGELSSAVRVTELPSGDRLFHYEVRARIADLTTSVPVVWLNPPARTRMLDEGTRVVVVGHVHRRFHRVGATTVSRTELRATRVVPTTRKVEVERLLQRVLDGFATGSGRDG